MSDRPRFVSVPFTPAKIAASNRLVRNAQNLELAIIHLRNPEGQLAGPAPNREQALALTKLEEAVMWANRALAVSDLGEPPCVPAAFTYKFEATAVPATAKTLAEECSIDGITAAQVYDPWNLLAVAEQLGAGEYANYNDKVAYKLVVTTPALVVTTVALEGAKP